MKNKKLKFFAILLTLVLALALMSSALLALPASASSVAVNEDNYAISDGYIIEDENVVSDDYIIGDDYATEEEDMGGSIIFDILFWLGASVIGLVIPAILFVLGIVLPLVKKWGFGKYWFILSGVSAVWMLSFLGIATTIITFMMMAV